MFAEWSDPNDIDHYFDEVETIFPTEPSRSAPPEAPKKSAFVPDTNGDPLEVLPNSIFVDGHPVGAQPKINILRSADRETYQQPSSPDWRMIFITTLAFVFLLVLYLQTKAQLSASRMSISMLMYMLEHAEKKTAQL